MIQVSYVFGTCNSVTETRQHILANTYGKSVFFFKEHLSIVAFNCFACGKPAGDIVLINDYVRVEAPDEASSN